MSSSGNTFVDECLAGHALASDIDDWVDDWHDSDDSEVRGLNEFLGFTDFEGKLWAEKPQSLGAILASRKYRAPLKDVLQRKGNFQLAARSVNQSDAESVFAWLVAKGHVDTNE